MEEQVISIGDILETLKKRWKMITIITLVATLLSGVLSFFVIKPQYEASTKVFIGKEEGKDQSYNQSDVIMYQQLMKTYSEAIKTKDLVGRALEKSKIDLKPEDALKGITVVPVANTQVLEIKFKSGDSVAATNIIKAVTEEFITVSKLLVPNGNIRVIETVELPDKPVSPNKKMNIAVAGLLGLMVSVGLCFLLEFLDNTYKNKEQLERELDIPVIGIIPRMEDR